MTPVLRITGLTASVAIAAAIGVGTSASAGAAVAAPSAPRVAACATSQLRVWYGAPDGVAAGSSYLPLEFSNTGTGDCVLDGYPGVSAVAADGTQLGSSATWNPVITPSAVVLAPGDTAHIVLQVATVANYPTDVCEPTEAYGLRVYPPNQTASVVLPFAIGACTESGPTFLSVDAVNAGVGIPFYSNN
ncbi:MAG TPA: DUF4232 domain-containing protein [Actinocrinis sp.]